MGGDARDIAVVPDGLQWIDWMGATIFVEGNAPCVIKRTPEAAREPSNASPICAIRP
jgi:hypothetical protein